MLEKIAEQFYSGEMVIQRLKKGWRIGFGRLDEWEIRRMPYGESFEEAALAAYKRFDKELKCEIVERIIKPVDRERAEAAARRRA